MDTLPTLNYKGYSIPFDPTTITARVQQRIVTMSGCKSFDEITERSSEKDLSAMSALIVGVLKAHDPSIDMVTEYEILLDTLSFRTLAEMISYSDDDEDENFTQPGDN